jgi:hypothetical protein
MIGQFHRIFGHDGATVDSHVVGGKPMIPEA